MKPEKWQEYRHRVLERRERRLAVEERETRKIEVTLNVSVAPSWTDEDVISELMAITDESLYEDSDIWVKQVKLCGPK